MGQGPIHPVAAAEPPRSPPDWRSGRCRARYRPRSSGCAELCQPHYEHLYARRLDV